MSLRYPQVSFTNFIKDIKFLSDKRSGFIPRAADAVKLVGFSTLPDGHRGNRGFG